MIARIVIILLSGQLLFDPSLVCFFWLQHQKNLVKKDVARQINEGMAKEELTRLQFTLDEVQTKVIWRSKQEFEYNHQLYDIVETMVEGDTVFYWCWPDQDETKLEKGIQQVIAQALGRKEKGLVNLDLLISFFRPRVFLSALSLNLPEPYFLACLWPSLSSKLSSFNLQPPSPPPRPFN